MNLNPSQTCAYGRALSAFVLSYHRVAACPRANLGLWDRSQTIALRRLLGAAPAGATRAQRV